MDFAREIKIVKLWSAKKFLLTKIKSKYFSLIFVIYSLQNHKKKKDVINILIF